MVTRRQFIGAGAAATAGVACAELQSAETGGVSHTVVLSTWEHGLQANQAAWKILSAGGRALDAVEDGARVVEADPDVLSVGIGGLPDRDGVVTLDASIMDEQGDCGSVAYLQHIQHPVSVARLVMENTPHVMLVGDGALEFAMQRGLSRTELLTNRAKQEWGKWKAKHPDAFQEREINVENHDTIGIIAIDKTGDLSGACTTSGMAWKLGGRVGDSPIIGAGLYVDNEVGAATATGVGEAVIRACGSFLVVEFMRHGHSPQDACRLATERVISKNPDWQQLQVGFIALDKQGRVGSYAIQPGFDYAVLDEAGGNRLVKSACRVAG
ncbi:N(4)-(beta-N-acetylglucosaminyl)-L-asparaginase [Pirellulales bacterium]|nr:N(4)-(beta-N-acetylglucosaminyl)-L-asparaginase [Pirellulales bacterium]